MALCRVAEQDLGHPNAPFEEDIRQSTEETIKPTWLITIHTSSRKHTTTFRRLQAWITDLWAEVEVVQWIARRPGARAWVVVPESALSETTRYGTVGELVSRASDAGARVERRGEGVAVHVAAAITQTLGPGNFTVIDGKNLW